MDLFQGEHIEILAGIEMGTEKWLSAYKSSNVSSFIFSFTFSLVLVNN